MISRPCSPMLVRAALELGMSPMNCICSYRKQFRSFHQICGGIRWHLTEAEYHRKIVKGARRAYVHFLTIKQEIFVVFAYYFFIVSHLDKMAMNVCLSTKHASVIIIPSRAWQGRFLRLILGKPCQSRAGRTISDEYHHRTKLSCFPP